MANPPNDSNIGTDTPPAYYPSNKDWGGDYPGANPFSFENGSSSPTVVGGMNNEPFNPATSGQSWGSKLFPNGVTGDDLFNLGKTALGIYGAVQPIPTDSKSNAWNDYLQRSAIQSHQGLTPEELSFATRRGQGIYANDLEAIRAGSGGNASTYLGNAGRAADSLYGNRAEIAVADANARRLNFEKYGQVLGQDNQLNRQLFLDKLNYATENKKSGAALASDALYNLHNQGMYNKQYGEGSPYQKWIQAQIDATTATKDAATNNSNAYMNYLGGGTNPILLPGAYSPVDTTQ